MSIDDVRGDAASFVDKWRARWPEWEVAEVFVPAGQRGLAEAWFALLQELTDAAWAGADPTPGLAKLAWWQEELGGWAKGARRHPLGQVLQAQPAPWRDLGRALPALRTMRDGLVDGAWPLPMAQGRVQGGDTPSEQAAVSQDAPGAGFAALVADCEHALFGGRAPDAEARDVVLQTLLGERSLVHAVAARASTTQGGAAGDAAPVARRPLARAGSRPRGIIASLTAARLERPAEPLPPLRALFTAWRGARRAG